MKAKVSTFLTAEAFNTERNYDFFYIEAKSCGYHSGSAGPNEVSVTQAEVIHWHSDFSVLRTGWRLCGEHVSSNYLLEANSSVVANSQSQPHAERTAEQSKPQARRTAYRQRLKSAESMVADGPSEGQSETKVLTQQTKRWLKALEESPWAGRNAGNKPWPNKTADRLEQEEREGPGGASKLLKKHLLREEANKARLSKLSFVKRLGKLRATERRRSVWES